MDRYHLRLLINLPRIHWYLDRGWSLIIENNIALLRLRYGRCLDVIAHNRNVVLLGINQNILWLILILQKVAVSILLRLANHESISNWVLKWVR